MFKIALCLILILSINSEAIKGVQYIKGINEKNTESNTKKYVTSSDSKCNFKNNVIKSKAQELTKGLKTDLQKANAIFKFVRDNIKYSYYNDSKKGAALTLKSRLANCSDQTNLLVALCRASGIPIRYIHGLNCYFLVSKHTYGHVWAQILIDNVWYAADTTSSSNTLGFIKNWNVKKYSLVSKSALLSF
jgi:transglutaminase-like putative cysteine protease